MVQSCGEISKQWRHGEQQLTEALKAIEMKKTRVSEGNGVFLVSEQQSSESTALLTSGKITVLSNNSMNNLNNFWFKTH